jgi:hypothetical protein
LFGGQAKFETSAIVQENDLNKIVLNFDIWIYDYIENSPSSPSPLAGEGGGEGEHILSTPT